jgi:pimeloyl-ACP methyl ester carboxylesterase
MSFVESHGVPLYYERHGAKGPTVVFCHGAGSNAATWWQQIPLFSREFSCIAIDHRCFGRSAAAPEAFRPELFMDDLVAVLDAERVDRAALIGQSLGGIAALRLALRHPERVWAFVPCDSPLAVDHPQMLANVRHFLGSVAATEIEDRALGPAFVSAHPELTFLYGQINRFNRAVYAPGGHGGWGRRLSVLFEPEFLLPWRRLRELMAPTLFVVGSEDPIVTPEVVRELAAVVPKAQVHEVFGAGHSPYFEQSAAFNAAVLDFLRRHAP